MDSTQEVCRVFVNLPDLCDRVLTFQLNETDLVSDIIMKVCAKFHLATTTEEAQTKYALMLTGYPRPPKYFQNDLPLYGFLPKELTTQMVASTSKARLEFVYFATKLVIIGLDRQNITEEIDFCQEHTLAKIVERMGIEYGFKTKDLYLVSPTRPTKELSLTKSALDQDLQHGDVLLLKNKKKTSGKRIYLSLKPKKHSKTRSISECALTLNGCALPPLIFDTMKWIEINAIEYPKIFQLGCSSALVEDIIRKYQNSPFSVDLDAVTDPFAVCEVFKEGLRNFSIKCLPSTFWSQYHTRFVDNPIEIIKILKEESKETLVLLKFIVSFLHRISKRSDKNRMTCKALADEFCPIISAEHKSSNAACLQTLIENPEFVPKKMQTSYKSIIPELLFAEEIIFRSDIHLPIKHISAEGLAEGLFFITNYRIIFKSRPRADGTERSAIYIPLAVIRMLEKKTKDKVELTILTKANVLFIFSFPATDLLNEVINLLDHCTIPQTMGQLFAYQAGLYCEDKYEEFFTHHKEEYIRQGVDLSDWKYSDTLPSSIRYPREVLTPAAVSLDLLQRVVRAYTNGAFPTLLFCNQNTAAYIFISGTLNVKKPGSSANLKSKMEKTPSTFSLERKHSSFTDPNQAVKDKLMYCNAFAMLVPSGSFETIICEYPGLKRNTSLFTFQKSSTILKILLDEILEDHTSPESKLVIHQWLSSLCSVLTAATTLTMKLYEGTSVLLEDDDFISFPIASLAMIMLDPYYRTIAGFQVLIDTVWIRYGFPFASSALLGVNEHNSTHFALFVQFMDCTWQMHSQFNSCFEFNESFLLEILQATTSAQFGTFLVNNEKDATFNCSTTISFWHYIRINMAEFKNKWYNADSAVIPLIPDSTMKRTSFWATYYLNWLSTDGNYQASVRLQDIDEITSVTLSHLLLTSLPPFRFKNFEDLDLSFNLLCTVPQEIVSLRKLRSLKMESNLISFIPQDLIVSLQNCPNLTSLDFSDNRITCVDDSVSVLSSLRSLKLGGSGTFSCSIPSSIFTMIGLTELCIEGFKLMEPPVELKNLTNLVILSLAHNCLGSFFFESDHIKSIDLNHNQLKTTTSSIGKCPNLTSLNMNNNHLQDIPPSMISQIQLKRLFVGNNQLNRVSPYLGRNINLEHLDISGNNIKKLPPLLGKLPLERFKFKGNPLVFPDKQRLTQTSSAILHDLRLHDEKQVETRRVRLMIVGQENVGKSSMSFALRNGSPSTVNISTDGIYINPFRIEFGEKHVDLDVWDFAGQEIYYTTHQLFLSDHALYLVVWNIMDDISDTKLEYWLNSIKLLTKNAPTILVATHVDQEIREKAHKTLQNVAVRYHGEFPFIKGIMSVSCTTCSGIPELQTRIAEVLAEQSFLSHLVPGKYEFFEQELLYLRKTRVPPVLTREEYKEIALLYSIEGEELERISLLLHNWGVILYYTEARLKDYITLDPRWLIQVLSDIITTKHRYIKQGILDHSDLIQIWNSTDYPTELHSTLMEILERFEITFPLGNYDRNNLEEWQNGRSLVPSSLPPSPNLRVAQIFPPFEVTEQFARVYKIPFVPSGFLNHVIIHIMQQLNDAHYWRFGVAGFHPTNSAAKLKVELLPEQEKLTVLARGGGSMKLFLVAVDIIEAFIGHWPNLEVTITAPCPHCFQERKHTPYFFPFQICKEAALRGESYLDCAASGTSVRLDMLVPDLSMADVSRIVYSSIEIQKEIGKGGFATVYKALYQGKVTALKELDIAEGSTADEIFSDFIRETWIMNGIQHPNIIGFVGICTKPLCIMTDYAAYGNLYEFLHDEKHATSASSLPLKLKIALDIAHGMHFLHTRVPPVVHSDLKSPNILLHSTNATDAVVAVVADFGLSKTWIPVLKGRHVDNPVWLAPEILAGKGYSECADVYAFGVMLYEILTLEAFFSEYTFLAAMEDAIIAGKRPSLDGVTKNNPKLVSLIEDCWQNEPESRPSFKIIIQRLEKIIAERVPATSIHINCLVETKRDSTGAVWANTDDAFVQEIPRDKGTTVTHCALTNAGSSLWCFESDGSLSIWDVEDRYTPEKCLPLYFTPVGAVLATKENTVWTTAANKIHIWCGFTSRLLKKFHCPFKVISFVELENDVCAVCAEGLLFWDLIGGAPSRFDHLCPPFPVESSGEMEQMKNPLSDSLHVHLKRSVSSTICYYQYFTRAEIRNSLLTSSICSDSSPTVCEPMIQKLEKAGIIRRILNGGATSESNDENLFVWPDKFFGDVEILSMDEISGVLLSGCPEFGSPSSCYYDAAERILWLGGKTGMLILDMRTISIIARLTLSSPVEIISGTENAIWCGGGNDLFVVDKFSLLSSTLDGHDSAVTHISVSKNNVWTFAGEHSMIVWTKAMRMVREVTLRYQYPCSSMIYVPSNDHILTASIDHQVCVWSGKNIAPGLHTPRRPSVQPRSWDNQTFSLSAEATNSIIRLQSPKPGKANLVILHANNDSAEMLVMEESCITPAELEGKVPDSACYVIFYYELHGTPHRLFVSFVPDSAESKERLTYISNFASIRKQIETLWDLKFNRALSTKNKAHLSEVKLTQKKNSSSGQLRPSLPAINL